MYGEMLNNSDKKDITPFASLCQVQQFSLCQVQQFSLCQVQQFRSSSKQNSLKFTTAK